VAGSNGERQTVYPILLVGFGYSGRRFAHAVQSLSAASDLGLVLGGVCDIAADARSAARELAPAFADLDQAVEAVRPAGVIVAVNEEQHARVLHRLAPHQPALLICEKPLTATLEDALELPPEIVDTVLTVNFVERQSPVLASYRAWADAQSWPLRPRRVEFWWGKHRIADPRPTIGVLSEITHPIDLVDYLFGFERFELIHAHGIASDFSPHHERWLDTVTLVARADDYVVTGSASFVWPRRQRRVSAILAGHDDQILRVTADFDTPEWDCDRIQVEEIDRAGGSRGMVFEAATDHTLFRDDLFGIGKVASFVEESWALARSGVPSPRLVGFGQALKIQRILDDLNACVRDEAVIDSDILSGSGNPTLDLATDHPGRP
jgi:predicted dehydrogenase